MLLKWIKTPIIYMYSGASYRTKAHVQLIVFLKRKKKYRLASYIANRLQKIQGVYLSPKACFDASVKLCHPVGVVIGEGVRLGKNVVIYQNVTLGGARVGDAEADNYPEIGANTVIFAGAAIIGKVKVGSNCVIGANSVVTVDIPDNCLAVGAPARFIKRKEYKEYNE